MRGKGAGAGKELQEAGWRGATPRGREAAAREEGKADKREPTPEARARAGAPTSRAGRGKARGPKGLGPFVLGLDAALTMGDRGGRDPVRGLGREGRVEEGLPPG